MSCDCIKRVEEGLAGHKLDIAIMWRGNALVGETYTALTRCDNGRKETRSGKPKIFAHTYCPFCGVKYAGQPVDGGTHA